MYMNAKKLLSQKNYIMKHKKITEMEIEEIKRELQERQRSHLEEREEEKLEQPCTVKNGEQKPSLGFTTGNSATQGSDSQIKRKN
jgi:D-alanine-D-alanine ligase-like ATP-grasp enzyme